LVKKQDCKESAQDNEEVKKPDLNETNVQNENIEEVEAEEIETIDDLSQVKDTENEEPEKQTDEGILNTFKNMFKDSKSKNQKLEEENKLLHNELDTLKDRLARTSAEYENYRKRSVKEKEGIYTDACSDVLKELIPVFDNLERALKVDANFDELRKGIEITIKQYEIALEKLQVEEVNSEGEFNPNLHNAVMHIEDEKIGKNQIVEVFQKGYKRGDKILRYSMVKVAN
jgi:molecular chaperone GrpE